MEFLRNRSALEDLLLLRSELLDAALNPPPEAVALDVEAAHGPVGLLRPRHERIGDGGQQIDPLGVELDVGVEALALKTLELKLIRRLISELKIRIKSLIWSKSG